MEPETPNAPEAFLAELKADGLIKDYAVSDDTTDGFARFHVTYLDAIIIAPAYDRPDVEPWAPVVAPETHFWILSFVDPARPEGQRHLGTTVVAAGSHEEALRASWRLGLNPGGEVAGYGIVDDGTIDQEQLAFLLNTLRSRAEMEAKGYA